MPSRNPSNRGLHWRRTRGGIAERAEDADKSRLRPAATLRGSLRTPLNCACRACFATEATTEQRTPVGRLLSPRGWSSETSEPSAWFRTESSQSKPAGFRRFVASRLLGGEPG